MPELETPHVGIAPAASKETASPPPVIRFIPSIVRDVRMATDASANRRYGPRRRGTVQGLLVKSFLILFAAVAPPVLLYATLSETDFAAIRELAPWALMLLGFAGMAVSLRARGRGVRPPIAKERPRSVRVLSAAEAHSTTAGEDYRRRRPWN